LDSCIFPYCSSGSLKWDISNHTAAFPTDAYGTLEFQGTGEGDKSKVCLSKMTVEVVVFTVNK